MRGINLAIRTSVAINLTMLIGDGIFLLRPPTEGVDYPAVPYGSDGANLSDEERVEQEQIQGEEREKFSTARIDYEEILFFVALPIGILLVVVGGMTKVTAIGNGLVFGGVFTLIFGYYSYWNQLSDLLKFSSLLIALALLIFTAYRIYGRLDAAE